MPTSSTHAKMKGGIFKVKGRELTFLLIVLVCTTVIMLAWERTPLLSATLPEKYLLQTSSEIPTNLIEMKEKDKDFKEADLPGNKPPSLREAEGDHTQNIEQSSNITTQSVEEFRSSSEEEQEENIPKFVDKQVCNYAKGKWVLDDSLPLYSGFGCKQWLASMWACRLMQRTDFSYENIRWQPKNCNMERFEGHEFLKRMQDKTLAFVGDSLGRQQFQSLMCMITGGLNRSHVLDVGEEYGFITPQNGRPSGWAYRFPSTNTTVLFHWSSCLCDVEPIDNKNPKTHYAMHLDRPPAFLRKNLDRIHVLVLNTGHHWNRGKLNSNRWIMYVGGVKNTNRKLIAMGDAKNFTIHSIVSWVNSQLPQHPQLKAFYRSISPRHFVGGDWNTGGSCDNTKPMSIGKELLDEASSDYSARNAVQGTGVNILDITALSKLRDEGHISRYSITAASGVQDCLHWCLPGVPDTWNEILFAQISDLSRASSQ
ncbi:Protein trichome birefringence-like 16 [Linum perenne]